MNPLTAARPLWANADAALSFWPTPPELADDLVHWLLEPWHGLGEGVRVLEPSAGEGHLILAIRNHLPDAHIVAVEPSARRAAVLRALPAAPDEAEEGTLEDYMAEVAAAAMAGTWRPFDLVVMNPPFTLPGRPEAWAEHILAIYHDPHLLAPGAVIGAVVPHIVLTGSSKRVRAVQGLLRFPLQVRPCERGAFSSVGAQVSAALLWAQKPLMEPDA